MSALRWEVLTRIGSHWKNVWEINGQPEFFGTYDDACIALNEHLAECEWAVSAGYLRSVPDAGGFRVVEVPR